MFRERELPQHYFSQLLYRRGAVPRDFIGRKRGWEIRRRFFYQGIEHSLQYLENKHLFWVHAAASGIPVIDVLAHSTQHSIFSTRSSVVYPLEEREDAESALREIGVRHGVEELFAKPVYGHQGGGCIAFRQGDAVNMTSRAAYRMLRRYPYVIQPKIDQHPDLEAVNPSSVNTIRMNVVSQRGSEPRVLTPFAKFGTGGSVVDNASGGGVVLPLDRDTGAATGRAFRFLKQGGKQFERHPDTGYPFKDFRVPGFDDARAVAIRASERFPHRFIGWDIAITETGPIVVEGNSGPNLDCIQTLVGGFRRDPDYSRIFAEFL